MLNRKGERVPDGVYLATITVVDASGKKRKRIEQITVGGQAQGVAAAAAEAVAEASAPQEPLAPTGAGTAGRLAKWTSSTNLGNSVITEAAGGRVGVNAAPAATLQVNGLQPAAQANTGAAAVTLLQTSGGKGGNTTVGGGKVAGAGASISLVAGQGGDAPAGSKRGQGGNITLQPGSTGAGAGTAGLSGNVLIAPTGVGNVSIGTGAATSRLTVNGVIQTTGAGSGIKFPDGSLQTKATTITGAGTANRITKFTGPNSFGNSSITEVNGNVGIGTTTPEDAKLHVVGDLYLAGVYGVSTSGRGVYGSTTDGEGVYGHSAAGGNGVYGYSGTGRGVYGSSPNNKGVYGESTSNDGVFGQSTSGSGVFGQSNSTTGASSAAGIKGVNTKGGWAGYFDGPVAIIGGCQGCTTPPSDRALKANISAVDPRSVLDKLASVPIQQWNYKNDSPSIRHVGPMAQDFRAAFQLGRDDKHIDLIDANGVTMASIQALYQLMLEKDRQNQELVGAVREQSQQIGLLRAQLQRQQAQLNQVKRTIRRKRGAQR